MHEVKDASLVRIRCLCGWFFYNENLKGKSDDDLDLELRQEFEMHKKVFD